MLSPIAFLLSIGLQLTAAVYALSLIRVTGRKTAWILIAAAITLMAARRITTFVSQLTSGKGVFFDLPEWIALLISGFFLLGLVSIGRYFKDNRATEETLRKREEALRRLAQGVSAATGEAFFRSLARHLVETLGVDYALVGKLTGKAPGSVQTLAVCLRGETQDNMEYLLEGTPCENVVATRDGCAYSRGIQQLFPRDRMLVDMRAECYMGAPLRDSTGRTLGLMAVLDSKPIENAELA
ncbi:MAG: hypothetical protein HZA23_04925, partial [Nitrospirae bacterium]|nr:hypothetical protein [Nitrospirota bacterium]